MIDEKVLIERLEKEQGDELDYNLSDRLWIRHWNDCIDNTIEIINQLAEEHNNGWIPCSERLPKKSGKYIVTQERYMLEDRNCKKPIAIEVDYVDFNAIDNVWNRARFFKIIAWMPLPAPYKGEQK